MTRMHGLALALAGAVFVPACSAQFADEVVSYQPGAIGASTLTNGSAGLGAPATVINDPVWGDSQVTPFNAPYLPGQIVSVGEGGSLTVRFNTPILNDPLHPYGLDFLIYGNTMFLDAAWPNPSQTDGAGTTFGENSGPTAVWVSADGSQFYRLNPSLAPVVDGMFPTDGQGRPGLPVNPALTRSSFANATLDQIRALYQGSAGGTGYDLAWAQDGSGQSVNLPSISFVRVDVLTGTSEIDAFAAVPEPAVWPLAAMALPLLGLHLRGRQLLSAKPKA